MALNARFWGKLGERQWQGLMQAWCPWMANEGDVDVGQLWMQGWAMADEIVRLIGHRYSRHGYISPCACCKGHRPFPPS